VHGPQHACNKFVDAITLLDKGHQGRNATLIICAASEMGQDELLKGINLVLKCHQVGDRFVTADDERTFPRIMSAGSLTLRWDR
jgi:hypothetical protein